MTTRILFFLFALLRVCLIGEWMKTRRRAAREDSNEGEEKETRSVDRDRISAAARR